MTFTKAFVFGAILLLGMVAWGQEYPKLDFGLDYSYVRYAPSINYTNGHSLNGGGGSVTYNFTEHFGIKMDLQGYGSVNAAFNEPVSPAFPNGLHGNVNGNMFTYLFGPQIKFRPAKWNPFAHVLFGGAHNNIYANTFHTLCQPVAGACSASASPSAGAFAMVFGGGIDLPIGRTISIRPVEVDYFLTRFSNPFTGTNNQSNFRYLTGVFFNLAHTH